MEISRDTLRLSRLPRDDDGAAVGARFCEGKWATTRGTRAAFARFSLSLLRGDDATARPAVSSTAAVYAILNAYKPPARSATCCGFARSCRTTRSSLINDSHPLSLSLCVSPPPLRPTCRRLFFARSDDYLLCSFGSRATVQSRAEEIAALQDFLYSSAQGVALLKKRRAPRRYYIYTVERAHDPRYRISLHRRPLRTSGPLL